MPAVFAAGYFRCQSAIFIMDPVFSLKRREMTRVLHFSAHNSKDTRPLFFCINRSPVAIVFQIYPSFYHTFEHSFALLSNTYSNNGSLSMHSCCCVNESGDSLKLSPHENGNFDGNILSDEPCCFAINNVHINVRLNITSSDQEIVSKS